MPRKLVADSYREAYDYWAQHFDDPALMTNRTADLTRFKVANVARALPLEASSRVLDVGPGDGALFRLIAPRVARCCGVDPSQSAVHKLTRLFQDLPNVEFRLGSSDDIPSADGEFDIVVMNSVIMILPSRGVAERTLAELVRACRSGGTIYIGEVPFCEEFEHGVLSQLARRLRDLGASGLAKNLYCTYLRPVLRGGPILLVPAGRGTTLHFPEEEFIAMCRRHGVGVETRRHREPRRPSTSRNDYILTLLAAEVGERGAKA